MTDLIDNSVRSNDMDYDETLSYTQNMRKRIVESMTEGGERMPDKPGAIGALLQTLSDMDNQTFRRREIDTDGQTGGMVAAQVSAFMVEVAKSLGQHNPLRRAGAGPGVDGYILPEPTEEFSDYELSQEINHGKTDYDNFTDEFLRQNPDYADDAQTNTE